MEIRSIEARLHLTFGHPPRRDLIVFCGQHGASLAVIQAIKALRCETCDRLVKKTRPTVAKIPDLFSCGQFLDKILMDIFYCPDARGVTRMFLGVIDDCTLLHLVSKLTSREPEHVWAALSPIWLNIFGLPIHLVCDLDGAFLGKFAERCEQLDLDPRYVPAESHWQLGRIERHNFTYKLMLGRVIDANGICTDEGIDMAVIQTSHAKNSSTKRAGRTSYQASWGRVPRLASSLLADDTVESTWINATPETAIARSELYRQDALKAFAELDCSRELKSAIHRQTALQKHEFVP